MTVHGPRNALMRLEGDLAATDRTVTALTRRVEELERHRLGRKAALTAIIGVGPLVTSGLVLLIALGDRLWGN